MHYIPGTEITISSRSTAGIRPGMTSAQIRAMSGGNSVFAKQREKLQPGVKYTLIRIHKHNEDPDKVVYMFTAPGGDRVSLNFADIKQAENFISEIRREQVPDYTEAQLNKTD